MTSTTTESPLSPLRAVSYVRVSTLDQARRGAEPEGLSIPAQREANRRRALEMGALIVAEFVERGRSGRSIERPELQRMLEYIQDRPVDFVIVHKIDRLARNRADDAAITRTIQNTGAYLVSTTEAISTTPSGRLLHGIMASIAEFYSQNLATEVMKGMRQKAIHGERRGGHRSAISTSVDSTTAMKSAPSRSTQNERRTSSGPSTPTPPASGASPAWPPNWKPAA